MVEDAFWLSIVSALIFGVYLDHFIHAYRLWRTEQSIRAFRNLFIAVMLQVGFLRIWIGATVRTWPDVNALQILQAVTAPVLTLMLLSGGFVLAYTWRRDR